MLLNRVGEQGRACTVLPRPIVGENAAQTLLVQDDSREALHASGAQGRLVPRWVPGAEQ